MSKRILYLFIWLFLLVSPATSAVTMEEAVMTANSELGMKYYIQKNVDGFTLNNEMWDMYKILVYGGPDSVSASNQDCVDGKYRYIGYTLYGDLIPNPDFPPDHEATTTINNWVWENPWVDGINQVIQLDWDQQLSYEPYITAALRTKYGALFNFQQPPKNAAAWYEITKILQPRTSVTPGLGRLWHNWNGTPWYITVLIPAELPEVSDLEAVSIGRTSPVLVNTHQVAQAVFKNNGKAADFTAEYYANGKKVGSEHLHIEEGETRIRNFSWTSPAKAGIYTIKIYAVPLEGEANIENNSITVSVVVQTPNLSKPDCEFTSKLNSSWDDTYTWEVYHPETCTDKDGKEYDCSWIETVSETVGYSESLRAVLSINTKQGITTDRDYSKESDRESRGSWEIIPYAQANGLDPNEVTRAGYGFEVKVKTTYRTDWETKVPGPASPHGGIYHGPYRVTAQFYDTSMRQVEEIELEATNGRPGEPDITWEIPLRRFEFSDGTYAWVRKHYTDVHNKDGYYGVRVIIEDCGRGQLSVCQDKCVTIYGDMYDDIYTRAATNEEW